MACLDDSNINIVVDIIIIIIITIMNVVLIVPVKEFWKLLNK